MTIEDFVAAMQDASGVDLTRFKRWYSQAGTPEISVTDRYQADLRIYELTFRQQIASSSGQPSAHEPLVLPIAIGLLAPDGREMSIRLDGETVAQEGTRVLAMTETEQTFRFRDVAASPVPSLFRGFSAPVKVKGIPLDRLKFLAAHDRDPFARWEAGQQVATHHLFDLMMDWRQGGNMVADDGLLDALRRTLAESDADPAFAAMALTLPSESSLADEMAVVDVEAIHAARQFLRSEIGRQLGGEFAVAYERLADHGPYRIDPQAIGARALRNVCLAYLAASGEAAAIARLTAQFDTGRNMTDVLAALALLGEVPGPARDHAFEVFYATWQQDDLVVDKWFALQAASPLPDTLERCKGLLGHPAFDLKNPNRVRSLVGAFSLGNQLRFHDASGAGYDFLADRIMEIDPLNTTLAARLTQPLGAWRRYDAARQERMRQASERILSVPGLSKGTYEMASKSLQ